MDDHDGGLSIFKVKAHRPRVRAIEEDGEEGDKLWAGNDAADVAAKSLAKATWDSREAERRKVEELKLRAQEIMTRAAICTHIAQKMFDKLGIPRAPARKNKSHRHQDPSACGDHVLELRPDGQGRWCAACHLVANTAASRRSLRARPCTGLVTERIPPSHHLQYSAGVLWCRKMRGLHDEIAESSPGAVSWTPALGRGPQRSAALDEWTAADDGIVSKGPWTSME